MFIRVFNSFRKNISCTKFVYPRNSLYSIRLSAQFVVLNSFIRVIRCTSLMALGRYALRDTRQRNSTVCQINSTVCQIIVSV